MIKNSIEIFLLISFFKFVLSIENPCNFSKCQHNSKCIPLSAFEYECQCDSMWSDKYCSSPTTANPCFSSPCKFNSTCLLDKEFDSFQCICATGYGGTLCDIPINQCLSLPCKNQGTCTTFDAHGYELPNYYRCKCKIGFTGINCETSVNYCESMPCLNNSTCVNLSTGFKCLCPYSFNGTRCENSLIQQNATCACPPGFSGRNCEIELNYCNIQVNPCKNGVCVPNNSTRSKYQCYCLPGFTGSDCSITIDICSKRPCKYGGTCKQISPTSYSCYCRQGTIGTNCENDIMECASNPCKNNATCLEPSIGSYKCTCNKGYKGTNCESNESNCASIREPCQNGGTCIDKVGGIECVCPKNYKGSRCEIPLNRCLNSNMCMNGGTCILTQTLDYKCLCPTPYTGPSCNITYDVCSLKPCANGATCISFGTSFQCKCPSFYTGVNCETFLSPCFSQPCSYRGKCYEIKSDTYKCFCAKQYEGINCERNVDYCDSNPCGAHGVCISTTNGFSCQCIEGFTGRRCENEVNACDSYPCENGGLCSSYMNSYNCTCPPNFRGYNCEIAFNPCYLNPCKNFGRCIVKYGRPYCQCVSPYYGNRCQFSLNACQSKPCQNSGICSTTGNGYYCTCPFGFEGDNCEIAKDICSKGYCMNGGTCISSGIQSKFCECPCNYTGNRCETPIKFCDKSDCFEGSICIENDCGFSCNCRCDYTGSKCDVPIDQCGTGNDSKCFNGGTCTAAGCGFNCTCLAGFTGQFCEIRKNLCEPNRCLNGATCMEDPDDYYCQCPCKYFTGKNCEFYTNICDDDAPRCFNGGTCVPQGCSFSCSCAPGFSGEKCEKRGDPCTSTTCYNNGTCMTDRNSFDGFRCQCTQFYTGPRCSDILDANTVCSKLTPCKKSQICVPIDEVNYICTCPPNYTGKFCDFKIRKCDSKPCLRGGQCIENLREDSYSCSCPTGTTGLRCEADVDVCASSPCNFGTCIKNRLNNFQCVCPPGVTGLFCQIDLNECLSMPCIYGNCFEPALGQWSCNCSKCFTGERCDSLISTCTNQSCSSNGLCIQTGPCKSICLCNEGYTGTFCETKIDYCLSLPCKYGATCVNKELGFQCICPPGYTGALCSDLILFCSSLPCENGLCIDEVKSFKCSCFNGWTGKFCEIDINECEDSLNKCQNNSTCVEDRVNSYKCLCPPGFTGILCETLINPCRSQPCLNDGKCTPFYKLNVEYKCECAFGWFGSRCEFNIDECESQPCMNDGTCVDHLDGYMCLCKDEYYGDNCEKVSCENYCFNGGICVASGISSGAYCICKNGFSGNRCQILNDICQINSCVPNQGVCVSKEYGSYECLCLAGFSGEQCEIDINECSCNPCVRGLCNTYIPGHFRCECPIGFTGKYCEIDLKPCVLQNPCLNGGVCMLPMVYNTTVCEPGLTGDDCEIDIDECASNPCKSAAATCVQTTTNSFKCICPPYETGQLCETKINLCDSNPCSYNAQCVQVSYLDIRCICPPGYTGDTCTERINECNQNGKNPCFNGVCVIPMPGTYRCNCLPGYKGPNCESRINYCEAVTCLNGGYCINKNGSNDFFYCLCSDKYSGKYCERPVDLCQSGTNPCGAFGTCLFVSAGVFQCKCNRCYEGATCNRFIDPCTSNPCKNNGNCLSNTLECSYKCDCLKGYEGSNCEKDVNPCLSFPCLNGGTCVNNSQGGYDCKCTGLYSGTLCDKRIDPCLTKTCFNNGTCIFNAKYDQVTCICPSGFTGDNCSQAIDFCAQEFSPCLNNGICVSGTGYYTCKCTNGFTGSNCELLVDICKLIEPCKYGTCFRSAPGDYLCSCFKGWTGRDCSVKINNCDSAPCENNSTCVDLIDGYSCNCLYGYTGPTCSAIIDPCLSNPCLFGICLTSNTTLNSYECTCDEGYTGANCDNLIDLCVNNSDCQNNSTCKQIAPGFAYCDCLDGYNGKYCEMEIDMCTQHKCLNNGICKTTGPGKFICECPFGYNGTFCQFQNDVCVPNPCNNGTCQSRQGFYICECPPGFAGRSCEIKQKCDSYNPCKNNAVCNEALDGTITCTCLYGTTGTFCEKYINICVPNPCQNEGICTRFNATNFYCQCKTGLTGQICTVDVDECQTNVCKNGGTCQNTFGSYKCLCIDGFTGPDCTVSQTNPCQFNKCNPMGSERCDVVNETSYLCFCKNEYTGKFCERKIKKCDSQPCLNGATCVEDQDGFYCKCTVNYTGQYCELLSNMCYYQPCGLYGVCQIANTIQGYKCDCALGYTGANCDIKIDYCSSKPCYNNGTCVNVDNSFKCNCSIGFAGNLCETKKNPCKYSNPCLNNATCVSYDMKTTRCICSSNYTGQTCQTLIKCDCKNGGVCNSDKLSCKCPLQWTGPDCSIDVNECLSQPCFNNGTCVELPASKSGGYYCSCRNGFTDTQCTTDISECSSNPCKNGICTEPSVGMYKCTCFTGYIGINCEIKLSNCSTISCGYGKCDELTSKCICDAGYEGEFCNVNSQKACLSSPCRNGATCTNLLNGKYECNCTPEYIGPNCAEAVGCIKGFDYCASSPCLNNGKCVLLKNCSFICICDSDSYGDLCQFKRDQSVFSTAETLNLVLLTNNTNLNFKDELAPCIKKAWIEANPQFTCPPGFDLIPDINRCFTINTDLEKINKQSSEYFCYTKGASLIAFETKEKFEAVISKLLTLNYPGINYFWLNSAIYRNVTQNPIWVWSSGLANTFDIIDDYNWGLNQSNNFDGDAIYLNTTDYKFYVGLSSEIKANGGVLCESSLYGLREANINVVETSQKLAFTKEGKTVLKTEFSVDITPGPNIEIKRIKSPNISTYADNSKLFCSKEILSNDVDVFSLSTAYYIDLCGTNVSQKFNKLFEDTLLKVWLVARPEYFWCSKQKGCVEVFIIKGKEIAINFGNKITRLYYIVRANKVIISPAESNLVPTADMMKLYIEGLSKNLYEKFSLCGMMFDVNKTSSFITNGVLKNQDFYIVANINPTFDSLAQSSMIQSIKLAILKSLPSLNNSQINKNDALDLKLTTENQNIFVLLPQNIKFDNTLQIDPIISYTRTRNRLKVKIFNTPIYYSTQSLFNIKRLYRNIEAQFADNFYLKNKLNTVLYSPFTNPSYTADEYCYKVTFTTRIAYNDFVIFENIFEKMINAYSIEFRECKNCWKSSGSYRIKIVYQNPLIDINGNHYFDIWFMIFLRQPFTDQIVSVKLIDESDFQDKMTRYKDNLISRFNKVINKNFNQTAYKVYDSNAELREIENTLDIYLSQSILFEDKNVIVREIKKACSLNEKLSDESFEIEYWGQSEHIRNSTAKPSTYWEPYFYVVNINNNLPKKFSIYNVYYDVKIDFHQLKSFLNTFNSSRENTYSLVVYEDYRNDFETNEIFLLPCFGAGPIRSNFYPLIAEKLQVEWNILYKDVFNLTSSDALTVKYINGFYLNYYNLKGPYAVYPYIVLLNNTVLYSDSYQPPSIEALKMRLRGLCILEDNISDVYREDSLFYIQVNGYISNEQAQPYIPTIINAWNQYYTPIQSNLSIISAKIVAKQYRFNNFNIITRIYYQVISNYSINLNGFSYYGKLRSLLEVSFGTPNLVARTMFASSRHRSIQKKASFDVILDQLPQIQIESDVTLRDKVHIEKVLEEFWFNLLKSSYKQFSLHIQLATSQEYFDSSNNMKITKIYYILELNDTILYLNSLPILNNSMTDKLINELYYEGYNMTAKPTLKVRQIFLNTNSTLLTLDMIEISNYLTEAWNQSIVYSSAFKRSVINATAIQQNLYYDENVPLIGVKYVVSINGVDPESLFLLDPPKSVFDECFHPYKLHIPFKPLIARRFYAYMNLIKDIDSFKNDVLIRSNIVDIWKQKNLKNKLNDGYFSKEFSKSYDFFVTYYHMAYENLYSNVPFVNMIRSTYTVSISFTDPSILIYEIPNENDFNKYFLISRENDSLHDLMGFCFYKCYNYRQCNLDIPTIRTSEKLNLVKIINAIKNAWIENNRLTYADQLKIYLPDQGNHQITDEDSNLTSITYNIQFTDESMFNDAYDLLEPDKELFYKHLNRILFNKLQQITESDSKQLAYKDQNQNLSTDSKLNTHLEWWIFFVIGIGCLFLLTIVTSLIVRYYVKNIFQKRHSILHHSDMSLVRLRENDDTFGTLSSSFDSTLPNRMPLSRIEPIFKPMIGQHNNLKLINRTSIYPVILSNPVYNDVPETNDELVTNVYVTNPSQNSIFSGPNYESSGIKPVQSSTKTWEQVQNEKSSKINSS